MCAGGGPGHEWVEGWVEELAAGDSGSSDDEGGEQAANPDARARASGFMRPRTDTDTRVAISSLPAGLSGDLASERGAHPPRQEGVV